jgi:hypothetical protein
VEEVGRLVPDSLQSCMLLHGNFGCCTAKPLVFLDDLRFKPRLMLASLRCVLGCLVRGAEGPKGAACPVGCSSVSKDRGFSTRLMWREGGAMVTYAYYPVRDLID